MTLSVCPHLVWKLRIRKYKGGEARKVEVGYQRSSNIIEDNLSEEEVEQCEDIAIEWNTNPLPDEIQHKYIISNPSQWSIDEAHLDSQRQFWQRSQISWSSSISGLEQCSLRSQLILMQMVNRHMQGNNPVAYSNIFALMNHEIWDWGASVFQIQTGALEKPQKYHWYVEKL